MDKFDFTPTGLSEATQYLKSIGVPIEGFQSTDGYSIVHEANSYYLKLNKDKEDLGESFDYEQFKKDLHERDNTDNTRREQE